MTQIVTPRAPGKIGEAATPEEVMEYLAQLGEWLTSRRQELAVIDTAILRSPDRAALTNDIALALSVWQAIKNRYDALLGAWDSGRVAQTELLEISTLIWGRMETSDKQGPEQLRSTAMSLPEACRMSDALTSQLRTKLAVGPNAAAFTARVAGLRAQLDRIRDQIAHEPPAQQPNAQQILDRFAARLATVSDKVARGGDVGGMLSALEVDAARFERDLIVTQGKRRENLAKLNQARARRAELEDREGQLAELVARCARIVTPTPNYAVPNVAALGAVPNTPGELDRYLAKLDQVTRAMDVVHTAYTKAIQDRDELELALQGLRLKQAAADDTAARVGDLAAEVLSYRPCPVPVAAHLVDAYREALHLGLRTDLA